MVRSVSGVMVRLRSPEVSFCVLTPVFAQARAARHFHDVLTFQPELFACEAQLALCAVSAGDLSPGRTIFALSPSSRGPAASLIAQRCGGLWRARTRRNVTCSVVCREVRMLFSVFYDFADFLSALCPPDLSRRP